MPAPNMAVPGPVQDALHSLAARALDQGAYDRVRELFVAAQRRGMSAGEAARWERLLVEAGDFTAAGQAAALAGHAPGPDETAAAQGDPEASEASEDSGSGEFIDFEPGQREAATPRVPGTIVSTFLQYFRGRGDVYARQWYDSRRDRCGYWPVREPLSARAVEDHLLGRLTLGQYLLHPDDTVSFAALDLDPTAEALEQMRLAADGEGGLSLPPLADYAARVMAAATRLGLWPVAEDTGGVGLHIWLFFAPRIPAARARAVLRELLWRAGPQPPAVAVELFPKQDRLSAKGFGNLIKLPLGIHQATLRASQFLDAKMQPVADADALGALRSSAPGAIDALLAARVIPLRAPPQDPSAAETRPTPASPPTGPSPRALAEALAAIPCGRESAAAADRILAGCAILRDLARCALEDRAVSVEAARALLYTVGLVGRGNDRIEALFKNAAVSRKELDRVRRGLQAPAGCRKLRERFPGFCDGCACPPPSPGGYATPVLFALREPPQFKRKPWPWPTPEDLGDATGAVPGVDLQQRLARIEAALAELLKRDG